MPEELNQVPKPESAPAKDQNQPEKKDPVERWISISLTLAVPITMAILWVNTWWQGLPSETKTNIKAWLGAHWLPILATVLASIAFAVFSPVRRRIRSAEETTKVALTIFVVLPAMIFIVSAVALLKPEYQVAALRSVFFLTVSLFPASMYYLFIATRKYGILNEFVLSVDRLGLLKFSADESQSVRGAGEPDEDAVVRRKIRITTYLQKFQAAYGRLPIDDETFAKMIQESDGSFSKAFAGSGLNLRISNFANIFTTGATIPVLMATILIALGWSLALHPVQTDQADWKKTLSVNPEPVYFAFLGAYFFAVQALFRRYVRRDLRGSAYAGVSLRIILAVVGTWLAVALFPAPPRPGQNLNPYTFLLALGFAVGVFPPVVWQLLRQFMKRVPGVRSFDNIESNLPLNKLDGINLWHQARLEEEDIENIHSMATADLVDLLLSTRFPPDRLIDWVDQALLYTALSSDNQVDPSMNPRRKLRDGGIRTASALIYAHEQHADSLQKLLDADSANVLIDALRTNPNLVLVQNWRSLSTAAEKKT